MPSLPSFEGIPDVSLRECTLLLRVPDGTLELPGAPLRLPEGEFRPKDELHVTVVGRALGALLREREIEPERLAALAGRHEWMIHPSDQFWLLGAPPKPGHRATRQSLIQLVDIPAFGPFLDALAELSGFQLPVPRPHLTWFTRNWDQGIGLDSEAEFRERRVRRLDPREVQMVTGEN